MALKSLQYNFEETDAFLKKFVSNKTDSIVTQLWKDKVPESMDKMTEIVPLYIYTWDKDDDGYYKPGDDDNKKKIGKTAIILIVLGCIVALKKKGKSEKKNL